MKITKEIEQAKQVLMDNGYFVNNLWHIDDVKHRTKEDLDEEICYSILEECVENDFIMEQINDLIDQHLNNGI